MSPDLPEPRVVPTAARPPISSRTMAAVLVLGVIGLFVGLARSPWQSVAVQQSASQPATNAQPMSRF